MAHWQQQQQQQQQPPQRGFAVPGATPFGASPGRAFGPGAPPPRPQPPQQQQQQQWQAQPMSYGEALYNGALLTGIWLHAEHSFKHTNPNVYRTLGEIEAASPSVEIHRLFPGDAGFVVHGNIGPDGLSGLVVYLYVHQEQRHRGFLFHKNVQERLEELRTLVGGPAGNTHTAWQPPQPQQQQQQPPSYQAQGGGATSTEEYIGARGDFHEGLVIDRNGSIGRGLRDRTDAASSVRGAGGGFSGGSMHEFIRGAQARGAGGHRARVSRMYDGDGRGGRVGFDAVISDLGSPEDRSGRMGEAHFSRTGLGGRGGGAHTMELGDALGSHRPARVGVRPEHLRKGAAGHRVQFGTGAAARM